MNDSNNPCPVCSPPPKYFEPIKIEVFGTTCRQEKLEELLVQVKRLIKNSMFLIGADKIKEIIKELDNV